MDLGWGKILNRPWLRCSGVCGYTVFYVGVVLWAFQSRPLVARYPSLVFGYAFAGAEAGWWENAEIRAVWPGLKRELAIASLWNAVFGAACI